MVLGGRWLLGIRNVLADRQIDGRAGVDSTLAAQHFRFLLTLRFCGRCFFFEIGRVDPSCVEFLAVLVALVKVTSAGTGVDVAIEDFPVAEHTRIVLVFQSLEEFIGQFFLHRLKRWNAR